MSDDDGWGEVEAEDNGWGDDFEQQDQDGDQQDDVKIKIENLFYEAEGMFAYRL